ncbi:hypothetical protein BASA61_008252 [Batrachochytrium salamandrivorans]|nr:hypothetical protein BASA61_008252 [Batrachochytrium salamandrivorans]
MLTLPRRRSADPYVMSVATAIAAAAATATIPTLPTLPTIPSKDLSSGSSRSLLPDQPPHNSFISSLIPARRKSTSASALYVSTGAASTFTTTSIPEEYDASITAATPSAQKRNASLSSIHSSEVKVPRQILQLSVYPDEKVSLKIPFHQMSSDCDMALLSPTDPAHRLVENDPLHSYVYTAPHSADGTLHTEAGADDLSQQTIFSPLYYTAQSFDHKIETTLASHDSASVYMPLSAIPLPVYTSSNLHTEATHSVDIAMRQPVGANVQHGRGQDEGEIEDDEFDPFYFIRTLPPLTKEQLCRPCVLPKRQGQAPPNYLDLDETLVHCSTSPLEQCDLTFPVEFNNVTYTVSGRFRPHYQAFLQRASEIFEVVVFTASQKIYADRLLNIIDPDHKYIKYRLFRDSCLLVCGNYLKDLNILGRDLAHTVIVDNSPQAFAYQISNGVPITSWYDDYGDTELLQVMGFLESIKAVDDVRPWIQRMFSLEERILAPRGSRTNSHS